MQQIERYGVIALVFLLVTIVAVSFWGDSKSPGFWKRLTGRAVPQKQELAEAPPATTDRAVTDELVLTPPAPAGTDTRVAQVDPATQQGNAIVDSAPMQANGVVNGGFLPMPNPVGEPTPGWQQAPPAEPQLPVAPLPEPAPRAAPAASEYVVQKGDSLALIAQRSLGDGQRWKEISDLNGGIEPKRLQVGMKLRLPGGATAPTRARETTAKPAPKTASKKETPAAKPASKPGGGVYVVKSGDTLRSIAEARLGSSAAWKDIVAANPGIVPSRIKVGQELRLPSGAATARIASAVPASARSTSGASTKPVVR